MQRLARRDRGSALVIAVIMILVTVAMIGLLLAAPEAQLQQVASAVAKERSLANADAGIRDAVEWMTANRGNLTVWVSKNNTFYISTTPGTTLTSDIPSGLLQKTSITPDPTTTSGSVTGTNRNLILVDDRGSTGTSAVLTTFLKNPGGFPVFASGNYKPFGDRHTAQNEYAFCILDEGSGYYRILSEGRALASSNNNLTQNTVTSRIEAYIYNPISTVTDPAAVTMLNPNGGSILNKDNSNQPSGWTNPDSKVFTTLAPNTGGAAITNPVLYSEAKGSSPDKIANVPTGMIDGTDAYTGTGGNDPTTAIGTTNNTFTVPNTITGSNGTATPAVTGGSAKPVDTALGSNVTSTLTNLVNSISSNPSQQGVVSYTYTGGVASPVGSTNPQVYYTKIPDNTTVTSAVFDFSSGGTYGGVMIIDVGNNVTFDAANPLLIFNGQKAETFGAFIFYQRGSIKLSGTGLYLTLATDSGSNNPMNPKLQWNSYDYRTAIANLSVPLRITSYRVFQ